VYKRTTSPALQGVFWRQKHRQFLCVAIEVSWYDTIVSYDADLPERIRHAVQRLPQRRAIARVRLFGSRLRGDARHDSDVDLLVDFSPVPGMLAVVSIERDLAESLGMHVDLVTPGSLSKYIRDDVLASAVTVYEKE
jgi:predicted nucleotidyltransferase